MIAARKPANEEQRLDALTKYRILDTVSEQAYDDITFLASVICGVPMALMNLIDRDRLWVKSKVGIEVVQTSRDLAFCAHAILQPDQLMLVRDATTDERFLDNPYVIEEPKIRFYAGAPLVTPDGAALGTLCVLDQRPRELTLEQREALSALSRQIVAQLELRRAISELTQHADERATYEARLEAYQRRLEGINASLSAESQTDRLTGISNRRYFDEMLLEEVDRAHRRGWPLSLLMIDVDHFKGFNDQYGHPAGDETLRAVAQLIEENKRPSDLAARYGGEEFVVLLPNAHEEGAGILAERIRKAVHHASWPYRPVTISVGVCTFTPAGAMDPGFDPIRIVQSADSALYTSKTLGRNRVSLSRFW